jgi:beta-glucanase (GH16 family)
MATNYATPAPPAGPGPRPPVFKPWAIAAAVAVVGIVLASVILIIALREEDPIGVGGRATAPATTENGGPPMPVGQQAGWDLRFADEFEGTSLDLSRWTDLTSAAEDMGHGNKGNKQLEWNQAANCQVKGGELIMTARRQAYTSQSGQKYDWTSCLISSTPGYGFRYGYIEERAVLPGAVGFWPAFWTWQAPMEGGRSPAKPTETDVYELYTNESRDFHVTQHSGSRGFCKARANFDPTKGYHTYGASIEPSGTTWYFDGAEVCKTAATADAETNILSNLAVFAEHPPEVTEAVKAVDYIRAWERA